MTKILIKKQLMEVFSWIYQDKKTGKNRDKKGLLLYVFFYVFLFGFLAVIFYNMAASLCGPLVEDGFGWLYIALMGIVGMSLGVFGSVFNTFASLYQAKDNDLLLSLPLPTRSILIARLYGVYAMGLMYELLVMVPAMIVYFMHVSPDVSVVICCILIILLLSVFILTLSCVLGWIVAFVSSKLKNQKIITVLISLAFFAAYYYVCGSAGNMMQTLLLDPAGMADKVKGIAYPLYQMGLAAEGKWNAFLFFAFAVLVLFAVIYFILQKSFLALSIANKGNKKAVYVEKKAHTASIPRALLRKEVFRFTQSPIYMLNCGLGIVFILFAAVMLLVKKGTVDSLLMMFIGYEDRIALVATAAICMITTMNDMAAPSVSLEGKNIWILQVLPVSGWQVLKAKLGLQIIFNLIPTTFLIICVEWILKPAAAFVVLIPLTVVLFIIMMAAFGLTCNLKAPNLKWTNETVPVKQSMSVTAALFGGWIIVAAFCFIYYLLYKYFEVKALSFLAGLDVVLAVLCILLLKWLCKKGSFIFETLTNA